MRNSLYLRFRRRLWRSRRPGALVRVLPRHGRPGAAAAPDVQGGLDGHQLSDKRKQKNHFLLKPLITTESSLLPLFFVPGDVQIRQPLVDRGQEGGAAKARSGGRSLGFLLENKNKNTCFVVFASSYPSASAAFSSFAPVPRPVRRSVLVLGVCVGGTGQAAVRPTGGKSEKATISHNEC